MKHASLFTGIGGFDLAAQWMGWENVFQVEKDKFCNKVLEKNFPNVKRYGDIKEFDGTEWRGAIDVLSGGFPCQPFSGAGNRKGKNDPRFLWEENFRIIEEIEPKIVVSENVIGLATMENGKTLDRILSQLESLSFNTESYIIPACAIGAWHQRERVWIVANNTGKRYNISSILETKAYSYQNQIKKNNRHRNGVINETLRISNVLSESKIGSSNWDSTSNDLWDVEPNLERMVYGVSERLDKNRIKSLGNAIVPQIAVEIFKAIEQVA